MEGILKYTPVGCYVNYNVLAESGINQPRELQLHPKATEGWSVIERENFFKKFVDKLIKFEIVSETIRGEFSAMGGGYTHYQVQFAKPIKPKFDWEYWKHRCLAAEQFIEESPCDPDIYPEQLNAYYEWQKWVEDER